MVLFSIASFGQYNFDLNKIKFNGQGLKTTKEKITRQFGQGRRVETNYECGFFASNGPGAPYYQLVYSGFNFIGSDKEGFYLQYVDFDPEGKIQIDYGDKIFSSRTTKVEFIKMFGNIVKQHFDNPNNTGIVLIADGRDDGARFIFKDGWLLRFEYWTPC